MTSNDSQVETHQSADTKPYDFAHLLKLSDVAPLFHSNPAILLADKRVKDNVSTKLSIATTLIHFCTLFSASWPIKNLVDQLKVVQLLSSQLSKLQLSTFKSLNYHITLLSVKL